MTELRLTLSVPEAAAALGISRTSLYEAIRRGEVPALRFGRRLVIPRIALENLLARVCEGAAQADGSAAQVARFKPRE